MYSFGHFDLRHSASSALRSPSLRNRTMALFDFPKRHGVARVLPSTRRKPAALGPRQ